LQPPPPTPTTFIRAPFTLVMSVSVISNMEAS